MERLIAAVSIALFYLAVLLRSVPVHAEVINIQAEPSPTVSPAPAASQPRIDLDDGTEVLHPALWVEQNLEGGLTNLIYRTAKMTYIGLWTADKAWDTDALYLQQEKAPANLNELLRLPVGNEGVKSFYGPIDLVFFSPPRFTYLSSPVVSGQLTIKMVVLSLFLVMVAVAFLRRAALLATPLAPIAFLRLQQDFIRLLVAGFLWSFSTTIVRLAIDASNGLTGHFAGDTTIAAYRIFSLFDSKAVESSVQGLHLMPEYAVALAFYSFSMLALVTFMFARIIFIDVLLIFAPLGMLCLVEPTVRRFGVLWVSVFSFLLLVQPVLVAYLQLATATISSSNASPVLTLLLAGASILGGFILMPFLQNVAFDRIKNAMVGAAYRASTRGV
jgi:hypothetical protein